MNPVGRTREQGRSDRFKWLCPKTKYIKGKWISEYKIRVVVEKNIQYFKEPMACGNLKTRDNRTIKADLLLAGITQQITVILADKINQHKYLKSLRPFIA
jgi:hypothetical protein